MYINVICAEKTPKREQAGTYGRQLMKFIIRDARILQFDEVRLAALPHVFYWYLGMGFEFSKYVGHRMPLKDFAQWSVMPDDQKIVYLTRQNYGIGDCKKKGGCEKMGFKMALHV